MKAIRKIFSVLTIGFAAFNLFAAGPAVDSKVGYGSLLWGTSVQTAKMSGFDLKKVDSEDLEVEQKKFKKEIKIYSVESNSDKVVQKVLLYFCDDKLFSAIESLDKSMSKQSKLESRYGKFKQNGINAVGTNVFTDQVMEGKTVKKETIHIVVTANNVLTYLYDWDFYSKINKEALLKSGNASIVDELDDVSNELLSKVDKTKKVSFAFVALNSDDKNTFVENYVTDALTEAIFSSGRVKIIERANLEKILEEQKFQSSGLVDDSSAKSIGNIAGVDYVCYGTLKKMGEQQFNVMARVVDVESGEVIAISRTTVNKDKYLIDAEKKIAAEVKAEKVRVETEKKAKAEAIRKKAENCMWKVKKVRNEFDGVTVYTCTNTNADGAVIFFGYEKWDNSVNSRARVTMSWSVWSTSGAIEIKKDNGEIFKLKTDDHVTRWYENIGFSSGNKTGPYLEVYKSSCEFSKSFYSMITENEFLTFRDAKTVRKFQTSGLLDVLATQGITKEEIEQAFANEQF